MKLADCLFRRIGPDRSTEDYVCRHLQKRDAMLVYRGRMKNIYVMKVVDLFDEAAAKDEKLTLIIQGDGRVTEAELQEMETYMDGSPYRNRMRYVALTDRDTLK